MIINLSQIIIDLDVVKAELTSSDDFVQLNWENLNLAPFILAIEIIILPAIVK